MTKTPNYRTCVKSDIPHVAAQLPVGPTSCRERITGTARPMNDATKRRQIEGLEDQVGHSELMRVADLDEDLQLAAAKLSTHTALDGAALVESVEVERLLAERRGAMS
jgi:hypothetical protein